MYCLLRKYNIIDDEDENDRLSPPLAFFPLPQPDQTELTPIIVYSLDGMQKEMGSKYTTVEGIVELNVGGTHFTTYKTTLCKYKGKLKYIV